MLAWAAVAAVFGLILMTVPFGRVVAHSLYRLTPETVTDRVEVPDDVVDLAQVGIGTYLRHADGRLSWLDLEGGVQPLPLPAPCLSLAHRQRTTSACALGDAGVALLDASSEGVPSVRVLPLDGTVTAVMVIGTRLSVGYADGRVHLLDAGDTVQDHGTLDLGDTPIAGVMTPPGLLVATTGTDLVILEALTPAPLREVARVPLDGPAGPVDYVYDDVYAAGGDTLTVVTTHDPASPVVDGRLDAGGPITDLHIAVGTVAWASTPTRTLTVRNSLNGHVWWGPSWGPVGQARACAGTWGRLTCLVPGPAVERYDLYPSKDQVIIGVGLIVGLAILLGIGALVWSRPDRWKQRLVWALVGIGLVVWLLSGSYRVPIEALHILEYTVLGALAYRAVSLGGRGGLATAVLAVLVGYTAGLTDESIQWLHPLRTGSIEDVFLDTRAASVGVLLGWQAVRFGDGGRSLPWALPAGLAGVLILASAAFQAGSVGFGQVHNEGPYTFTSRLDRAEIAAIDAADSEARRALLIQGTHLPYGDFLALVEGTDWFVYELAVHGYRRDRRLAQGDLPVACAEHRLMERIYARSLEGTPMAWGPAQAAACTDIPEVAYTSPVSEDLITVAPWLWWTVAGSLSVLLGALALGLGLRRRSG